MIYCSIFFIF